MENILAGNPLLNLNEPASSSANGGDFKVKRRWDDDVVFKNCAKGIDERKKESTFINDAIRSEFHRKFMDKYIKYMNGAKAATAEDVAATTATRMDDVKMNERIVVWRVVNGERRRVLATLLKKRTRESKHEFGETNGEKCDPEANAASNEANNMKNESLEYFVHFDGQDRRLDQWISGDQYVEFC
ncbi:unnamed protein product [Cylicostephanus goldi]|uniref:Tudor-knot domain-containing protein n=1 Tax=Cylicostephanus goldi TaxID=71465 RepID=A0A3P6RF99_CYLGO|nr:unnamed protein product [Cylicostephanus goldi]